VAAESGELGKDIIFWLLCAKETSHCYRERIGPSPEWFDSLC